MSLPNDISLDLYHLLIFVLPGFFFFKILFSKRRSDFEIGIYSLFWGICLYFLYSHILPKDKFDYLLQNPYLGAIVFSVASAVFATIIGLSFNYFRRKLNDRW
jgi:ABC-type spermidine/putrescine transport system permease subunit I